MSVLRRLVLAIALVCAVATASLAEDATTIVPGVSVGPIQIGMSEEQVVAILGKPQLRGPAAESGDPSVPVTEGKTTLYVLQYFKQKITILTRGNKVTSIMVLSPAYHTANGIGVDSRLVDVQSAFGAGGVRKDGQYGPDVTYPKEGIRFLCLGEQVFGIEVRPPVSK